MRNKDYPPFGDQVVLAREGVWPRMPEDLEGDGPNLIGRFLDFDNITTSEVNRFQRGPL